MWDVRIYSTLSIKFTDYGPLAMYIILVINVYLPFQMQALKKLLK